jgi:hypothetical protein
LSVLDTVWHLYVGSSWIGSLAPTGVDGEWVHAEFNEGDAWGNFAPWFQQAAEAYNAGDDDGWDDIYGQLYMMGMTLAPDDGGEVIPNPTVIVDGPDAWFIV